MSRHLRTYATLFCMFTGTFVSALTQTRTTVADDTLAQFGSTVVTSRELLQRLESVPFPGNDKTARIEDVRLKTLYAIIAEKLLGQEGERLGLRNDASTVLTDRELENMFIRDVLYKREVVSKIRVSDEEIRRGLKRLPYEMKVLSFLVKSRADGEFLARKLHGVRPEEVLTGIPPSLYTQVDTINIRFGAPDSAYENAAFSLTTSRISKPFKSQNFGWALIYLLDRSPHPDVQKLAPADRRRKVEKAIRDKHEAELAAKYYYGVLQSSHAKARERIFVLLADSLTAFWLEDTAHYKRNGFFLLTSDMIDVLITRLAPFLDSTLVEAQGGNITLGQVLEMLRYEDLQCKEFQGEALRIEFNEELKNLVARELIARKGRMEGLLNSPEVQKDMDLWTGYLSASAMWKRIRDTVTVSDEDIARHLIANSASFGKHFEVNVREVLTATNNSALAMLNQYKSGRAIAELARMHSIRGEWASRDGESGLFAAGEKPEIGFRALLSDSGKVVGPISLPEGCSVFEILEKRRTPLANTSFDSLKANIRVRLMAGKRTRSLDRVIADLARKENLVLSEEKLTNVRPTLIPTFVRRNIGFGGRMMARPLLLKQWDWIKEFQQQKAVP